MNLANFSLFRSSRKDQRQFAVIGLGRFGRSVCTTLTQLGYEVLGIDNDAERVDRAVADRIAAHCLQLDSTNVHALKEGGVFEFDTTIVAIGNYLEESIVTTLNLKEGGGKMVVAKASSEIHGTLLKKIGADLVVYPEAEMGRNLARHLTHRGILDRIDLDPEYSIVEVLVPDEFHDKNLAELKLRSDYGITVLAVNCNGKLKINPGPERRLQAGSTIVVMGHQKDIRRLPIACDLEEKDEKDF
jgi:trk system potassium uptake protein TrkA